MPSRHGDRVYTKPDESGVLQAKNEALLLLRHTADADRSVETKTWELGAKFCTSCFVVHVATMCTSGT